MFFRKTSNLGELVFSFDLRLFNSVFNLLNLFYFFFKQFGLSVDICLSLVEQFVLLEESFLCFFKFKELLFFKGSYLTCDCLGLLLGLTGNAFGLFSGV